VGGSAADSIVEERNANGPYKSFMDFMTRVNLRNCNKRCIEVLAMSGAFESVGKEHRAQYFVPDKDGRTVIDKCISYANKQENSIKNQTSLFDAFETEENETLSIDFPTCDPWNSLEQAQREYEVAGFYISGHPLEEFKYIMENFTNTDLAKMNDDNHLTMMGATGKGIQFVGLISKAVIALDKQHRNFGIYTMEDLSGSWTWRLFKEDFDKFKWALEEGKRVYVNASVNVRQYTDKDGNQRKFIDVKPVMICNLEDAYEKLCKVVRVAIRIQDISMQVAHEIQEQLTSHKGKTEFNLRIVEANNVFFSDFFNFTATVDPQSFLKDFHLSIPYKIELA